MGQTLRRSKPKGIRSLCSVCLENISVADLSALRCGHLFHLRCIKYWLTERDTCPECRQPSEMEDIITQLHFHGEVDEKKRYNSESGSDSSDESEKLDTYNELLEKLGNVYVELEKEKAKHEQTKEYLAKVQQDNLALVRSIMSAKMENGEGHNTCDEN